VAPQVRPGTYSIDDLKGDITLRGMLLAKATRLSVQPVDKEHFDYLSRLAS
jgi:hypothetical protein